MAARKPTDGLPFRPGSYFLGDRDTKGLTKRAPVCMCMKSTCFRNGFKTPSIHVDCHKINPYGLSPNLLSSREYSYEPTSDEKQRRKDWLQHQLTMKLKGGSWPKDLPYEIWESIATYLLREFATIHTQEQLFKGKWYESFIDQGQAREAFLDFEHDVYGRYIQVDGIQYIQQLRNCTRSDFDFEDIHRILQMRNGTEEDKISIDGKPHDRNEAQPGEVMIYDAAQHWTKLQKIYVEEDHLGIRQICFTTVNGDSLGEPIVTSPGGWWRELRLRGFCWYRTRTDVS